MHFRRHLLTFTLSCFALGCSSQSRSSTGGGADAALLDAAAASTSAWKDGGSGTTDSAPVAPAPDSAVPPPATTTDATAPREDSRAVDSVQAPADTREPDATGSPPDTSAPDASKPEASPSSLDTPPAGTTFHCPPDAGAATLGRLSPLELKTLLDGGENPFLINVKGESIGKIPGTDAVLVGDIPGIETLVGRDLCANIVLYCQSGNTSQTVASQLLAKGYRRIRDLTGGITAWKNAGYPTQ